MSMWIWFIAGIAVWCCTAIPLAIVIGRGIALAERIERSTHDRDIPPPPSIIADRTTAA